MHLWMKGIPKFSSLSLPSCVKKHAELLPDIDPDEFGINHEEPLFLFQKQG